MDIELLEVAMKKALLLLLSVILAAMVFYGCVPSSVRVTLSADNLGVDISEDLYGLFLEDISFACDGGLVSNLIANTGFEYAAAPFGSWGVENLNAAVETTGSMHENNLRYLAVTANGSGKLTNKGYVEYYKYLTSDYQKGLSDIPDMGFHQGTVYHLRFYVKINT